MSDANLNRTFVAEMIAFAIKDAHLSGAQMGEAANVASILWRSTGASRHGVRPEEMVGLADRIRNVVELLGIEVSEENIKDCELEVA